MRRKIVAGNWKLHGTRAFATALVAEVAATPVPGVELVVLPPLPYLGDLIEDFEGTPLAFGAQDVSSNQQGAFTGEVSAGMLVDVGAKYEVYLIMNQLAERGSGVLFISSEVEELMGVCDRIAVWSRGEIMKEFSRDEFSQESIMRAAFRQGIESDVQGEVPAYEN